MPSYSIDTPVGTLAIDSDTNIPQDKLAQATKEYLARKNSSQDNSYGKVKYPPLSQQEQQIGAGKSVEQSQEDFKNPRFQGELLGDKTQYTDSGTPVVLKADLDSESPEVRALHQKPASGLLKLWVGADTYDDRIISEHPYTDLAMSMSGKFSMNDPDKPIGNLPKPSPEFLKQNPNTGGILKASSDILSAFTTPRNIDTLGSVAFSPEAIKNLAVVGFTAFSAKNMVQDTIAASKEKDQQKRAELYTDAVATGIFATLGAKESLGKAVERIPPAEATAHLQTVSDAVLKSGKEMISSDPSFSKNSHTTQT